MKAVPVHACSGTKGPVAPPGGKEAKQSVAWIRAFPGCVPSASTAYCGQHRWRGVADQLCTKETDGPSSVSSGRRASAEPLTTMEGLTDQEKSLESWTQRNLKLEIRSTSAVCASSSSPEVHNDLLILFGVDG